MSDMPWADNSGWSRTSDKPAKIPDHSAMRINAWFDGGCRGNPGPAAGAAVLYLVHPGGRRIRVEKARGLHGTNNEAEYTGAILALELILAVSKTPAYKGQWKEVGLYGDSKLVVMQVTGRWGVNQTHLVPYIGRCKNLIKAIGIPVNVGWIPREYNERADAVCNRFLGRIR